ncbi:MAG TPA: hypothetical protein VF597_01040 [Candidatus Saccharimonadales bacterium]|jgi:hypothetical protein
MRFLRNRRERQQPRGRFPGSDKVPVRIRPGDTAHEAFVTKVLQDANKIVDEQQYGSHRCFTLAISSEDWPTEISHPNEVIRPIMVRAHEYNLKLISALNHRIEFMVL